MSRARGLVAVAGWCLVAFSACQGEPTATAPRDAGPDRAGPDGATGCRAGFTRCDGLCTETSSDPHHCGGCHAACARDQVCEMSTCLETSDASSSGSSICPPGYAYCRKDPGGPACSMLDDDTANCGRCGHACNEDELCTKGRCTIGCVLPESLCSPDGGTPYCADLYTSSTDCGRCGRSCGLAGTCQAKVCYCIAPNVTCAGTCIDASKDPDNCGGCGLTCSVKCTNGECVLPLASEVMPEGIAVDAVDVYVTLGGTSGAVVRVPIAGGPRKTLASGRYEPRGIAVDGANVYWADQAGGFVLAVPKGGGTVSTLASGQAGPTGIAIDAASVYFTNFVGGSVMSVPKTGGSGPSTLATSQNQPNGIAVDDTNVYWVDDAATGGVMELAKTAPPYSAPTELGAGNSLVGIAVDATNVYFASSGDGNVYQVPIAGGATVTLATGLFEPMGVATSGGLVYYADFGDGTVQRVLSGGSSAPTVLVSGVNQPIAVAVDSSSAYFVAQKSGKTVFKVTPR